MSKVLLYSGGMDSWLIDKLWKPTIKLYINTKTSYSLQELSRLPKDIQIIDFPMTSWERDDKIIPLRNLFFVMLGTYYGDEICLGATAGDRVLDKSVEFAKRASDLLSYLYLPQHWTKGMKVKITLPYKKYTKTALLKKYIISGGNINDAFERSFSCYNPIRHKECWECKPCFRKWVAFFLNNYRPQEMISTKVVNYINESIMPQIASGHYNRKIEEMDILKALEKYKKEED
jgi:7-cyano-7-deazaguanine synthase